MATKRSHSSAHCPWCVSACLKPSPSSSMELQVGRRRRSLLLTCCKKKKFFGGDEQAGSVAAGADSPDPAKSGLHGGRRQRFFVVSAVCGQRRRIADSHDAEPDAEPYLRYAEAHHRALLDTSRRHSSSEGPRLVGRRVSFENTSFRNIFP